MMTEKHEFEKPGIEIDAGVLGLSITRWEGLSDLEPDRVDCFPAIEPCGDDIYELWLHADGYQSVRILGDAAAFKKLGRALTCLLGPEWEDE